MSVDATPQTSPRSTLALVGGWMAGLANAVMAAISVIALAGADREWGMLGPLYDLRFLVIIVALAWLAGMICFGLAALKRSPADGLAGATGTLWLAVAGLVLLGVLVGLAQIGAAGDAVSILGVLSLLAAYIVTAIHLGRLGASLGMVGFIVALVGVVVGTVGVTLGGSVLLTIGAVVFYGGTAVGFIVGGRALAQPVAGA
ncbi:MAG: hypothetical protein EP329_23460 [Deltaproteobacteria bacterium]|nr:MAG: hypothetical protein EP329_23460 [Deltaproteobacteria bacterium]